MAISDQLGDGFIAFKRGDKELAHKKLLPLAIKGDVRAQFFLSVLLESRTGSTEDKDNAKKWLTASANNGFVPARFNLGNNYHQGKYGPANNKMAEYWWNQAAVQGFAEAQYYLATLYYWGKRGVKLNLKESFYWFDQAAKQGFQDAAESLLLIRAGEPLPPLQAGEPVNIAYDDPRIVSRLSLDAKQRALIKPQKKQIAVAPEQEKTPESENTQKQPGIQKQMSRKKVVVATPTATEKPIAKTKNSVPEHPAKDWVAQQPAGSYTIQLFASTSLDECSDHTRHLYRGYRLDTHVQSFIKDGRKYCAVVYGSYGRYSAAKAGLRQLPRKLQQVKPWIRKMAR